MTVRATIDDVALHAGVSRAAVSKVLRNAYGVSDSMRVRVHAAMNELDYRPRVAARSMRGRSFTIGIEVPDPGNPFMARVLAGAMAALGATPYRIIIAPAEMGSRQGAGALDALVDRQADGVIAISPRVEQIALERLASVTPLVMIGRPSASTSYDSIVGDDALGALTAMEHLLALGHKRIAHVTLTEADERDQLPHGARLRRYLETMESTGHGHFIEIWRADEGEMDAYHAANRFVRAGSRATAVFAGHDQLALGVLRAVAELGIEMSVVGYDDIAIASHPLVGLTTVHQPGEQMGARAAQMLLERIDGRTSPIFELIEPELRVRTTTRPVRLPWLRPRR